MIPNLVKKPLFWVVALLASVLCLFAVLHFFGEAFSVLDLDVRMSRTMAIDDARRINAQRKLSDAPLGEAVASFDGNSGVQTFIELEGGGKPALKPFVGGAADAEGYSLYRWRVRLFAPQVDREVQVAFAPDGRPVGFFSKVPENAPGASLTAEAARTIAVATAAADWQVDFGRYHALTASAVTRPNGRIDHAFVYERDAEGAPSIGEGRLRLQMLVTGDRLTQLQRYVYVPEAFARRYKTIRSANDNIAAAASIVAGLVYGLGGCLVGLIWLMRRHAVRWAPSAKWAAVVAVLIAGAGLAGIDGNWFVYDTATSASTFRLTAIGAAVVGGVVTWLLLTVVFATAEGLGRQAYGSHPQLWRTWRAPSAISRAIWGRTLAGYAWIGFDLAFIALFYFVVTRWLGWWSPSDALIDPNILGRPLPWLAPVSMALQAGMMEESLFRAVPLAGAALLGRHFGREKTFIVVALVVQAIVFGCAHANYPGQPAYARPIELFVPSLIWGIVYLRYGLVPGMLFHFGFDLVLMSIPLFVTDAPGIAFDRAMVIGILAIPLIVLVAQRLRAGRLIDLPDSERNAAAGAAPPQTQIAEEAVLDVVDDVAATVATPSAASDTPVRAPTWSRRDALVFGVVATVGLIGIGVRLARPLDAPGLTIDRAQALAIAERALDARGVRLDARWQRSERVVGVNDAAGVRFAWREGGRALFAALIGNTLAQPHWEVRFARFDGDVVDRDAWRVVVVDDRPAPDGIRLIEHDVPEARAGKRLTEAEARPIAEAAIASWLKRDPHALRAVSATASERPGRVDWGFIYADPSIAIPAGGEARIGVEIDGDEVAVVGRSLFVPESWARDERTRNDATRIPRALLAIVGLAFSIAIFVSLVRRIARGEASRRAAAVMALLMATTLTITTWLGVGAAQFGFTVAEPFNAQMLRFALQWFGLTVAGALFGAMAAAVGVRIASSRESTRTAPIDPWWQRWGPPLALALLVAGVGGVASLFGPDTAPREPAVGAAGSLFPMVAAFLAELDFAVPVSAALIVVALLSTRRRWLEVLMATGLVVAAMLARASAPDATVPAVAAAALGGLVAWLLYRLSVRDRPWLVAPTMLCLGIVTQLGSLAFVAYPGSRVDAVVAIVGVLIGYRLWRWLVRRDRRAR